jgi:hypothetical protein
VNVFPKPVIDTINNNLALGILFGGLGNHKPDLENALYIFALVMNSLLILTQVVES